MSATQKTFAWEEPESSVSLKGSSVRPAPACVVVIVEDDDDLRALCREILVAEGCEAIVCPTLALAHRVLGEIVPDVVLLDRELPDGDGLELARWLRGFPPFDGVRIVAFSGLTGKREVDETVAAGCDAFLAKPCSPQSLVRSVRVQRKTG
jgi:DNA-binding response OmpR family regulator